MKPHSFENGESVSVQTLLPKDPSHMSQNDINTALCWLWSESVVGGSLRGGDEIDRGALITRLVAEQNNRSANVTLCVAKISLAVSVLAVVVSICFGLVSK